MKILWSSNAPWTVSGYGQQTALTVPRIKQLGHEVAINCFYGLEGGVLDWNGITCFPTDISRFGNLLTGEYAEFLGGGDRKQVTVITLMDVWVLNPGLVNFKDVNFACWTAFHHDPPNTEVLKFLREAQARVLAMSRFGENRLNAAGFETFYVPHGVNTSLFKPDPASRDDYRAGLEIPRDAFVIGMVACNQGLPPRKSFPEVFQAFAQFLKKHNDAILFLHSDLYGRNNGVHLIELAEACGITPKNVRYTDQLMLHLGIPQELMPGVFNSFDVLAMPSYGEGFGIPLVEAQACGTPVITTDWTSMTELCGAGWLVDGQKVWDQGQHSWLKAPSIDGIYDAFEDAYENAGSKREAAREFALQYDVDRVFETCWKPTLEALETPREVAPLRKRELVAA